MRGDKPKSSSSQYREAMDAYLHTYYEVIRDVYLKNIYKPSISVSDNRSNNCYSCSNNCNQQSVVAARSLNR